MSASAACLRWRAEVSKAAAGFESRWTRLALRRVSPPIAQALFEQQALFDQSCVTGVAQDIETHGAAMCRGYAAAVSVLERASEPDDAYLLGCDHSSGLKVAVGQQKAAAERVRELHGERVVWVTPDEVAKLMASVEAFKFVGAVKQFFPMAEVIDRYPECPVE